LEKIRVQNIAFEGIKKLMPRKPTRLN